MEEEHQVHAHLSHRQRGQRHGDGGRIDQTRLCRPEGARVHQNAHLAMSLM